MPCYMSCALCGESNGRLALILALAEPLVVALKSREQLLTGHNKTVYYGPTSFLSIISTSRDCLLSCGPESGGLERSAICCCVEVYGGVTNPTHSDHSLQQPHRQDHQHLASSLENLPDDGSCEPTEFPTE
jgi:hypothetical protein